MNGHIHSHGTEVQIHTPENPIASGRTGIVREQTEYGYKLTTNFGSGEFRVLHSEVIPAETMSEKIKRAIQKGATGEICKNCQGMNVVKNGNCAKCNDCGETSGCS